MVGSHYQQYIYIFTVGTYWKLIRIVVGSNGGMDRAQSEHT